MQHLPDLVVILDEGSVKLRDMTPTQAIEALSVMARELKQGFNLPFVPLYLAAADYLRVERLGRPSLFPAQLPIDAA